MTNLENSPLELREKQDFLKEAARHDLLTFCQVTKTNYESTWFHEIIAYKLEDALTRAMAGEKVRIILTIPPRHGKSELASIRFPAFAIGKYPNIEFILSTYGADLSETMGMKTRDVIGSEAYQAIFPGVELRADQKSKAKWMTNKGGTFTAVGIGGAVTGIGAKCVSGSTLINTRLGLRRIDNLYHLQSHEEILSFNHEANKPEWKRIVAYSKKQDSQIVRCTTSTGITIECTTDHRIFTVNRGYIRAEEVLIGDTVIVETKGTRQEGVSGVQWWQGQTQNTLRKMLRRSTWSKSADGMQTMYNKVRKGEIRDKEVACKSGESGFLLLKEMFSSSSFIQKQEKVSDVSYTDKAQRNEVLRESDMQTRVENTKTKRHWLLSVWKSISPTFKVHKVLLNDMQGSESFGYDVGGKKSELSGRSCVRSVSERVSSNTKENNPKRWWGMCCLQRIRCYFSASYRSQSEQQCSYKSDNCMSELSYDSSSVCRDTISMVQRLCDEQAVYDIQVEDNNNFFANKLLVHNCILIDDPHKSREEAESSTVRETVWQYYRDTLYSRLEGFGAVIIIMQRWHTDDLVGRVLEDSEKRKSEGQPYDEWEVINFPAIAEEDEYHEGKLIRKQGDPLWQNKFSLDVLANIRAGSIYKWSSQYQQQPISSATQEFKEFMFKKWTPDMLQGKYLTYMTLVDPAISQKKEGDNTVVLTVAKEVDGPNFYRIREDAGHFTPSQTVDLIFAHNAEYHSDVWIETVAYQAALKYAIQDEQRRKQRYFMLTDIKTSSNKEQRIRGLLPLYQNGVIWHSPIDHAFEKEALVFPKGKHDDRIDCMSFILAADLNRGRGMKRFTPKWIGHKRG